MKRLIPFLAALLISLNMPATAEQSLALIVSRALEEGDAGKLLQQDLELEKLNLSLKRTDFHPYLEFSAGISQSRNIVYSFYEYSTTGPKLTRQKITNRPPFSELSLIKKFVFGPQVEVFTGIYDKFSKGISENSGNATTLLDASSYTSRSDVYNVDVGARFTWNFLGSEADSLYKWDKITDLEFKRSMLSTKIAADNFAQEVVNHYYDLCEATLTTQFSQELYELAKEYAEEQRNFLQSGQLSEDEAEQAALDLEQVETTFQLDTLALENVKSRVENLLGFLPECSPSLKAIVKAAAEQDALTKMLKGDDEAINLSLELAKIDKTLAEINYRKAKRPYDTDLNLTVEGRRTGHNHSLLPRGGDFENAWLIELTYGTSFNYKGSKYRRKINELDLKRSTLAFQEAQKGVEQSTREQQHQLISISKQLSSFTKTLRIAQERLDTAASRFGMGQVSRREVVQAKQGLTQQQETIVNLYYSSLKTELAWKKEVGDLSGLLSDRLNLIDPALQVALN